ncbi:hypothetical protein BaRGS_00027370 [Batillaria attramentaria]|uniref:Uncharacterized protein n=1 Tax=Batillaria attramentaria TaxID=370345 RepID=A0ABD0K2G5_9CAEN
MTIKERRHVNEFVDIIHPSKSNQTTCAVMCTRHKRGDHSPYTKKAITSPDNLVGLWLPSPLLTFSAHLSQQRQNDRGVCFRKEAYPYQMRYLAIVRYIGLGVF